MRAAQFTRRQALAAAAAAPFAASALAAEGDKPAAKWKLSACDWSIGKTMDIEAMSLAKQIGLKGVQVSFGEPGGRYDLRKQAVRDEYKKAEQELGVKVSSLALGVLNNVPYASDPRTEQWVSDSIDAAKAMDCRVVLLAFFGKGDIKGKQAETDEVIRRLKKVAAKAADHGVVLGIESWLSADEHLHIIDSVGSPAVQCYYDVANSHHMGYDIYAEIRQLGAKQICEMHMKENGYVLGHGRVDFKKVRAAIDDIKYTGWLVIEGATEKDRTILDCYTHNRQYLEAVFEL